MSPRGVAIPDIERRLFDAADRVLRRDGPNGLSSRAITSEAGTAKGILHRHFADLDAFLAAFVVDRAERTAGSIGRLPTRAGTGSVEDNLVDAAMAVAPEAASLVNLVHARWSMAAHFGHAKAHSAMHLEGLERMLVEYLEAERGLGRIVAHADIGAIATALVATVHQLAVSPISEADRERRVRRVVGALTAGAVPGGH